jgi:hypothetical protein
MVIICERVQCVITQKSKIQICTSIKTKSYTRIIKYLAHPKNFIKIENINENKISVEN